jgi:hypothetical protein
VSDDTPASAAPAQALAQVSAFVAQHGQPHVYRGEPMGAPLFTREAARELLHLLARAGIGPIGMEFWRHDGDELDIDGIDTWYPVTDRSLREIQADAMLYLDRIQPGPNDRLTVEFLDLPAVGGDRRSDACSRE